MSNDALAMPKPCPGAHAGLVADLVSYALATAWRETKLIDRDRLCCWHGTDAQA
jgi:hypothetical protein